MAPETAVLVPLSDPSSREGAVSPAHQLPRLWGLAQELLTCSSRQRTFSSTQPLSSGFIDSRDPGSVTTLELLKGEWDSSQH